MGDALDTYPGGAVPFAWKRMVQLKVSMPAISNKELAKELGVNPTTIALWIAKPEYQRFENWALKSTAPELSELPMVGDPRPLDAVPYVRARAETYLEEMQDRLMHILRTTESEKLQVEIILDQFDRVGLVSQKAQQRVTPIIMTKEAIEALMGRAAEAGLVTVDVEPVKVA